MPQPDLSGSTRPEWRDRQITAVKEGNTRTLQRFSPRNQTLKCHDQNDEVYTVTFTRGRITISSFADDAIMGRTELPPGRTVFRHWPEEEGKIR